MRGRSYSPSPPRRSYGRRGRSPSPRGRYGGRGGGGGSRDLPSSLLVRNLRLDCKAEDLRRPFGQFGPLKDIYLPKDYYSGEPRGFGFVQFVEPADAEEAKYHMDGSVLLGRQLTVVFAEENRKKPTDMRAREPPRGRHYDRRRSPPRYSRSPPHYERSAPRSRDSYSPPPKRRQYSRSGSPQEEIRYSRERSYSRSPGYNGRGRSPIPEHSPPPKNSGGGGRSLSRSPVRATRLPPVRGPPSRSPSRSRSPVEYSRKPRDESPSP